MKSPLRYCARKDKTKAGSTRFSVQFDETTGNLTYRGEQNLHGREETTWSSYTTNLSDLDPNLVRITANSSDPVWWMNLICRDYLDLVSVERKFPSSTQVTKTQCYLPIPIKRPRLTRPNFIKEFREWIKLHHHGDLVSTASFDPDSAKKIASLLQPANGVFIPSISKNREFTQTVEFLERDLVIERKVAKPKRNPECWRFPLLALEIEKPSVERLDDLAVLSLTCRFPLEECEWKTGYGDPHQAKVIKLLFPTDADAHKAGEFLHTTIEAFRTRSATP
jgi:hypothetical protein